MHVVYRYYTPNTKPTGIYAPWSEQAKGNEPVMLGPLPNIVDILTRLEAPFNCTAQIRVKSSEFLDRLRPGDEIRGPFGNTERHMRIDSIQYNDTVNTCTLYCVQTDMWIYSHRIAFEYGQYARGAAVSLAPYWFWRATTFQDKIRILYGFSIIPRWRTPADAEGRLPVPSDFPDGGDTNRPPPVFGDPLKDWDEAKVKTSFYMRLATVRDIMGSVVDLYKPAWNADTGIRFYPPWKHNLSRNAGMIRFISHGQSAVPTIGYGHGGQAWAAARLGDSFPPYGMEYERIYDISDEYDIGVLHDLTMKNLDTDKNEGEWWEVELLNDCGQELWIGDTVIGDFIGAGRQAVITRITYDQTPDRIHTYLYLGKAPATVTDRLNMLRLEARRDMELTWMKGIDIDRLAMQIRGLTR